jgi:hypothetical protein
MAKQRTPAVPGWFTLDPARPALLGTRCKACGTVFFPREETFCRSPLCSGTEFEEVELSRRGRLWSYTNHAYQPPAPYVPRRSLPGRLHRGRGLSASAWWCSARSSRRRGRGPLVGMEMGSSSAAQRGRANEYVVYKWRPAVA